MPRPKQDASQPSARDALLEAFWRLIQQKPYSKIKVKELATEANVNHNTFYYHFDDMLDLAEKAFEQAFPRDTVVQVLTVLLEDEEASANLSASEFEGVFNRIKLFAKPDSPELNGIIKTHIEDTWLEVMGLERSSLSPARKASLQFVLSGGLAVVGTSKDFSFSDFLGIINGPIGKSARSIIRGLMK